MLNLYRGLPRQVYILSAARLIAAMGMFIYPFLSLFLNTRMGFSELAIGNYLLLIAVSNIVGSLLSGKLADRIGRKRVYLWSMGLCVICLFLCGFLCDRLIVVGLLVAVYFFVSMLMPVLAAMITDVTVPEKRREGFSLLYLSTNIGLSVGPLVAGLLFYSHIRWIFWGQGISFFLAFLLVLFTVGETRPEERGAKAEERVGRTAADGCAFWTSEDDSCPKAAGYENAGPLVVEMEAVPSGGPGGTERGMLSMVFRSPLMLGFILCVAALWFCYIQVDFMLPLQVKELFGVEEGSRYFGIIAAMNGVAVVLLTSIVVTATRRIRPILNIAIASLFYAVGFGAYAVASGLPVFILLVFVWTCGEVLLSTSAGVFIAERAPDTHRARFQSLYELAQGLGRAVAPSAMGYFLQTHTIPQGWVLIGVIALVTGAVLLALSRLDRFTPGEEISIERKF